MDHTGHFFCRSEQPRTTQQLGQKPCSRQGRDQGRELATCISYGVGCVTQSPQLQPDRPQGADNSHCGTEEQQLRSGTSAKLCQQGQRGSKTWNPVGASSPPPQPGTGSSTVVGPTYLTVISRWMVERSSAQHRGTGRTHCQSLTGQHSHENSPGGFPPPSPVPASQICSPKHHARAF